MNSNLHLRGNLCPEKPQLHLSEDDLYVIHVEDRMGQINTSINHKKWRFPNLLTTLQSQGYRIPQDFALNLLILDKKIVGVSFPNSLIPKSPS